MASATIYAIFLRGINVGGVNIKMADLRKALGTLPLNRYSTLLATGNIVCEAESSAPEVKSLVEDCLRSSFGYDAWVVVLTAARLKELVAACPFPADSAEQHSYVTLSSDLGVLDELDAAAAKLDGGTGVRLGPEALAWLAPVGGTLDSPFSKIASKAKFKAVTTTRNLRTLIKVADAANAMQPS
ncbi:DUF1697 domain-containing protein [Paenarthrobacter sp. Z7-10]|uniref:DUF1697 domain-containing protein n=1 Tax=Paenarthrobacter sp. Z7-10 TaxID=2787635 RepID=UPI0022A94523|nr:DUF1697 domain-containing protein [Paenarthrobacter sp. Z7-10]MCZ2403084.1 DUF1697 domain-containing protein [Paenarthrobacter sp. Z7-10]